MASRQPFNLIGPRALPNRTTNVALSVLLFVLVVATGCIKEDDLTLEQRSHQLASQLMCPVCDGQTIDGSNAQISLDMRLKVNELLAEGKSNAEIKDYFVVRYGEEILAAPEGEGFSLLAWIVPVVLATGAIGIALLTIRNLRRSTDSATRVTVADADGSQVGVQSPPGDRNLEKYLAQVDRDLGISPDSDSEAASTDTAPDTSDRVNS